MDNADHSSAQLTRDQLLRAYRAMLLARRFDEALTNLYRQSKIVGGVYSQIGNEATSVGTALALEDGDILFPMHRDNGAHFLRGMTPREMAINFLFRDGAMTRGTDGTGHFADVPRAIYGNVSHLGAMVPVAAGAALAQKMSNSGKVVLNYIGDGGASVGEVHEGLTIASVIRLPLVLIIENNQYAYSTPVARQCMAENLSCRAVGYGILGETVDGTDLEAVFEVTAAAVARARRGEGPSIIESKTMRMRGHAEHDAFEYVPRAMIEDWGKKDPVKLFENSLEKRGIRPSELTLLQEEARAEIEEAIQYASSLPYPDVSEATRGVFI